MKLLKKIWKLQRNHRYHSFKDELRSSNPFVIHSLRSFIYSGLFFIRTSLPIRSHGSAIQHYQKKQPAMTVIHVVYSPHNQPFSLLYATGCSVRFVGTVVRLFISATHVTQSQDKVNYVLIQGSLHTIALSVFPKIALRHTPDPSAQHYLYVLKEG